MFIILVNPVSKEAKSIRAKRPEKLAELAIMTELSVIS